MSDNSDNPGGDGVMTSPVIGVPSAGQGPGGRPRLGDLRSHLTCVLCAGYFIDATTIVECLHTFCRSCILCHLKSSSYCPVCAATIHRTKGSASLRADRILQTLVYKMVPDLFRLEMQQRRNFYEERPYADPELPSWARGDVSSYEPRITTPDEHLQLRLELFDAERCGAVEQRSTACGPETVPPVRYLRCQAGTPLSVLHKFISAKFQLPPSVQVQLLYDGSVLPPDISLLDIGYTYRQAERTVISLSFRLVRRLKRPAEPTIHALEEQELASKRMKTDEQTPDTCKDTKELANNATEQERLNTSSLKTTEVTEEPDTNRGEEEGNTQFESDVLDIDIDEELVPEATTCEQDSGIFEPTGDEKSSSSDDEPRDEEIVDVCKPNVGEELDASNPSKTDPAEATVKQQESDDVHQEANAILQEIDLNRKLGSADREQAKSTEQGVPVSREDAERTSKDLNVGEREKDVTHHRPTDKAESIVVQQPKEESARKQSIHLERMFDPDDEEPTSPQIVEDIIASLDAECAEDNAPIPAVTALAPGLISAGSSIPVGFSQKPVTITIPRPGGHRLVNPISPLARVSTTAQVTDPAKVTFGGDPKRLSVDPELSTTACDVRTTTDASKEVATVTAPGSNAVRQVNSTRGKGGSDVTVTNTATSGEEHTDKTGPNGGNVRRRSMKPTGDDCLPRETDRETGKCLPSTAVGLSPREMSPLNTEYPRDRTNGSSIVQNSPSHMITALLTASPSSAKEKEPSPKAEAKIASSAKTMNSGTVNPPASPNTTKRPSTHPPVADISVVTSASRDTEKKCISSATDRVPASAREVANTTISDKHDSNRIDSCVSADHSGHKTTGAKPGKFTENDVHTETTIHLPDTKSSTRLVVTTEDPNIGTADSPEPANTMNEVTKRSAHRSESSGHGSPPVVPEKPASVSRPSISVSGHGTLTATGAAVRGISAIPKGAREGEVIIERVPNVFAKTSTADIEENSCPSTVKVAATDHRSKVDCSVQTVSAAKTGVAKADVPKNTVSVPPKMVDIGTAMAELEPAKRPASVPHRTSNEPRDEAPPGRRVSTGDSHTKRPTVSDVGMKLPSAGNILPKKVSSDEQHKRPCGDEVKKANSSANDGKFGRPSAEIPGTGKLTLGEIHSKLFSGVPRPANIPVSSESLRHVKPSQSHGIGQLTSGTHKPYASNVLKVPHVMNRPLLNKTHVESPSKTKHHKSKRSEHEKKPNVSYSLWKNMKTAKADRGNTEPMSFSSSSQKDPDPSLSANTPLDLTTHVRKTVAADSTSMLAKTPSPPPKPKSSKPKSAKAQGTQTIHSIVSSLASRQHISLTPIATGGSSQKPASRSGAPTPRPPSSFLSSHLMPTPMPEYSFTPGSLFTPPLHVSTSMASRLNYDLAMRHLLTLSHMAMAQGGMARPPHMFPMQPGFPPRPKSHEFPAIPDPSLLRQPSEARMGAASKKASPTAGTTAPQLRTPTGLTSASIQHMEDLTRTVGKRTDKERNSVTVTPIPSGE